jgi:hypothetical protein
LISISSVFGIMVVISKLASAAAIWASFTVAHPGETHSAEHIKREIAARDYAAGIGARSLGACGGSASAQEMRARAVWRRADKVQTLRQKRGITARESGAFHHPSPPPI